MGLTDKETEPLISVIMSGGDAGELVGRAIESVLSQTYKNIELIICNDELLSNRCETVKKYTDNRVVLCRENGRPDRSCNIRSLSLANSKGSIVLALDADDYIDERYIEDLYHCMKEHGVDACLGRRLPLDNGYSSQSLGLDYATPMTGIEAFSRLVPELGLGFKGCMARKELWEKAFDRTYKLGKHAVYDDGNAFGYMLLGAEKVMIRGTLYNYSKNSDSIEQNFGRSVFDKMMAEEELLQAVGTDYEKDSLVFRAVEQSDYDCYHKAFLKFVNSFDCIKDDDITYFLKRFKQWHNRINWKVIECNISRKNYLINKNYYSEYLLYMLKYKKIKGIGRVGKIAVSRYTSRIKNNKYHKWYIVRKQREKLFKNQIKEKYVEYEKTDGYPAYVINVIDGTVQGGGLADRLRGIIGTYAICKEKNLPYRLFFTYPFQLEAYLEPNTYDWKIDEKDICRNSNCCDIVILDTTEDSPYQFSKQERYLKKRLGEVHKQTQVFTNASFAYDLDYSQLFNELFKPSPRLQKAINDQKSHLGENYISISTRFLDLLGDFNETYGYGEPLSEEAANKLIYSTVDQIRIIHKQFPNKKMLINSDSRKFLSEASKLDYTYVIPGNITHIDNKQQDADYERYEKTFLDFMMIAEADQIYLLKGDKMHKSGYPFAASKINGRAFHMVEY